MSNYFTNFSLVITLKEKARKYALELARQSAEFRQQDKPVPAGFPKSLVDVLEDWNFETESEKDGIWLHSENGGIDAACAFIQHLLQQFDPKGRVTFEWSNDCSRPLVDAFGGGAAIITAGNISTMSTSDWLRSVDV